MSGAVVLLWGPPAAGKSSLARELLGRCSAQDGLVPPFYLSTDRLRRAVAGTEYLACLRSPVYRSLHTLARALLSEGRPVLLDGNYLRSNLRRSVGQLARGTRSRLLRVLVLCDLELALRRNSARSPSERVPEEVVRRSHRNAWRARGEADLVVDTRADTGVAVVRILRWLYDREVGPATGALPAAMQEWSRRGQIRRLEPGDILWRTGQEGGEVVLLLEGQLEVLHEEPGKPPVVLTHLDPPSVAGEMSLLDQAPHSATLRVTLPGTAAFLGAGEFRDLVRDYPDLLEELARSQAGRVRALSEAAARAFSDALTGLGNRRLFDDLFPSLAREAAEKREPLSLVAFDIDFFKNINDTYGHQTGDRLLAHLGARILETLPPRATGVRYGGDEFVLLLPGLEEAEAGSLLRRLWERVRQTPFPVGEEGAALRVTLSAGLACYPGHTSDPHSLYALADEAAYHSKRRGRDAFTSFGELTRKRSPS